MQKGGNGNPEVKRKREEGRLSEEAISPFLKSKKVERSPVPGRKIQKEERKEDMDAELMKMLREVRNDVKEIKEEGKQVRKEIEELKKAMKEREEAWIKEKHELNVRVKVLEEKLEENERRERKNNIVITGLEEVGASVEKEVEEWMKKELRVEIKVKKAYKINKGRMIVATLENWEQKRNLMENKKKLKERSGEKIYIDDDLTKNEREIQRQLREMAKEERKRGKRANVGYKKIWIEGKCMKWDGKTGGIKYENF